MAQDQKPSYLWEFRKQDDPDSSDEESQSPSSTETCLKQFSDSVATSVIQATYMNHHHLFMNKPVKNDKRMQFLNHAMKVNRNYGRKMKMQCKEPATISSNFTLMQAILEELRVKGEHLLEWMRAEVKKLIDDAKRNNVPEESCSKWKIKLKYRHDQ